MIEHAEEDRGSVKTQVNAAVVGELNNVRYENELAELSAQDLRFNAALDEYSNVRKFLGSPENILGSEKTKHGEIAEQVEVGVRNAKSILHNESATATFESVGRTAPEDYIIDGIKVQSKFINGTRANLDHVLDHMDKYQEFGRDGSYYHIPKDHFDIITKVRNGQDVDGLSDRAVNTLLKKVALVEEKTGLSFEDVVKPGVSDYAEIQQGTVEGTLELHEDALESENDAIKDEISKDHQASLQDGLKTAAIAGAISGGISLATAIYSKNKEGKKLLQGDYTAEDWKDIGVITAKGAASGAVTGAAIYGLTNCGGMAAPFAGAVVGSIKGIGSLLIEFDNGNMSLDELYDEGLALCSESAMVGVASFAGQVLIPIPVLGAVVGSIAGKLLCENIGSHSKELAKKLNEETNKYIEKLDAIHAEAFYKLTQHFSHLHSLTEAAFKVENNTKLFELSVELAEEHGVCESKIVKDIDALDAFMLD
ncbi:DUF3482 domain-containing protein [Photobacterium sp. ZSDE20]|uniref:DUF3482 domain-containing protein n=1 Tax=Photobacterium pectinilyticum TaxID=2906793 RepID=A0ABT1N6T2_9GAMM|nr:DUF3482 domain-containing protein [Photobacterium sp. ZSDE20]MCQ1060457.1 DUF3482 domain-containing protein [Photobacterium sp. ZSDE20]MDD1826207.1 DUF3482 domain-containing protein [Photobacterium sp. ZSDE20]